MPFMFYYSNLQSFLENIWEHITQTLKKSVLWHTCYFQGSTGCSKMYNFLLHRLHTPYLYLLIPYGNQSTLRADTYFDLFKAFVYIRFYGRICIKFIEKKS